VPSLQAVGVAGVAPKAAVVLAKQLLVKLVPLVVPLIAQRHLAPLFPHMDVPKVERCLVLSVVPQLSVVS
jgi:hypothetical protein